MRKKAIITIIIILATLIGLGLALVIYNMTNGNHTEDKSEMENIISISVIINNEKYVATLENNETAQAFARRLPQELKMAELNSNEKYAYLDYALPTKSFNPKQINAGDIMLYGDNCLVIFYKTFSTSYNYTRIGHIEDLPDLGDGDVAVEINYQ